MKLMIVSMFALFATGCVFSGTDLEETIVIKDYYISYDGLDHHLIQKQEDAATSAVVIESNVDSIGFNEIYILAVSGGKYYLMIMPIKALKRA